MGCFDYIVKEIPDVSFRPIKDRRNEYRILAVYATYLIVGLNRKLILVYFALRLTFHLAFDLRLTPTLELIKITTKFLT